MPIVSISRSLKMIKMEKITVRIVKRLDCETIVEVKNIFYLTETWFIKRCNILRKRMIKRGIILCNNLRSKRSIGVRNGESVIEFTNRIAKALSMIEPIMIEIISRGTTPIITRNRREKTTTKYFIDCTTVLRYAKKEVIYKTRRSQEIRLKQDEQCHQGG